MEELEEEANDEEAEEATDDVTEDADELERELAALALEEVDGGAPCTSAPSVLRQFTYWILRR